MANWADIRNQEEGDSERLPIVIGGSRITNHSQCERGVPPPGGGTHKGRSKTYGKTVTLCQIWEVWGDEAQKRNIPPCQTKIRSQKNNKLRIQKCIKGGILVDSRLVFCHRLKDIRNLTFLFFPDVVIEMVPGEVVKNVAGFSLIPRKNVASNIHCCRRDSQRKSACVVEWEWGTKLEVWVHQTVIQIPHSSFVSSCPKASVRQSQSLNRNSTKGEEK